MEQFLHMEEFLCTEYNAICQKLYETEARLNMERDANLNNMEPNTYMLHLQIEATMLKVAQLEEENNTLRGRLYVTEAHLETSNKLNGMLLAALE
jgi:hypothetical protein